MLIRLSALRNWTVEADEGEVGSIVDVYYDDERWGARYLVVETGDWLESRRVLLSPASVRRPRAAVGRLHVDLTREQVANAPDVDTDMPVSRHYEIAHALHYGVPPYWAGPLMWGAGMFPDVAAVPAQPAQTPDTEALAQQEEEAARHTHLRSARELLGYRVVAADGDAGDVDDLAIDEETWAVRHLVVDTRHWLPGGRVLLEPSAVTDVDWGERRVTVDRTRAQVKASPAEG